MDSCPFKTWSCWDFAKFLWETLWRLFFHSRKCVPFWEADFFQLNAARKHYDHFLHFFFKHLLCQCNQLFTNQPCLSWSTVFLHHKGSKKQVWVMFYSIGQLMTLFILIAFEWGFENSGLPFSTHEGEGRMRAVAEAQVPTTTPVSFFGGCHSYLWSLMPPKPSPWSSEHTLKT